MPASMPSVPCFRKLRSVQPSEIDGKIAQCIDPGPLAGVPVAAKNLFDIAGVTTLADRRSLPNAPPAEQDAAVVARLKKAGAVVIGAAHMDDSLNGFTTQNAHYGDTPIRTIWHARRAAPRAARRRLSPGAWCRFLSAPTPMARSGAGRLSAASSG